jgi:hypothetical protein
LLPGAKVRDADAGAVAAGAADGSVAAGPAREIAGGKQQQAAAIR